LREGLEIEAARNDGCWHSQAHRTEKATSLRKGFHEIGAALDVDR
jgi:hypothetical protein